MPVHVAVGLTPAQCKAYRIADNKSAELADWNADLLVQELVDLQKMDFELAGQMARRQQVPVRWLRADAGCIPHICAEKRLFRIERIAPRNI